ncbi:MAG: phytanoyl-CoA dioxygenase family protein [Fimbriimonadaceae bacterium]|nr:phytanoyl-CoA dioxygenase family protein [Fimbriimonadaceae bacterium]
MRPAQITDDFFFDLNGYLVLQGALEPDLLARLNSAFDVFPRDLPRGAWFHGAQRRDYTAETGLELHHCLELGGPFEELIDHPSWIDLVRHYCGEEQSYVEGLFIDECIASVRASGGHHPVHSGGYRGALRGRFDYRHGVFRCGQVNIICALTDIGPGDGATMVIPGSHKSNFEHPLKGNYGAGERMDHLPGAVPVHLQAGDAVLFVDGLMHGGSSRTNPGERRVTIYRYGVSWGATRFGYRYSEALLNRLTPARRRILEPIPPLLPTGDPTG